MWNSRTPIALATALAGFVVTILCLVLGVGEECKLIFAGSVLIAVVIALTGHGENDDTPPTKEK
jgi:type IV secretory pathway TrbF-like protein